MFRGRGMKYKIPEHEATIPGLGVIRAGVGTIKAGKGKIRTGLNF